MEEIWKDIPGYENIYQVSNLGNVVSLKYKRVKHLKLRINTYGYFVVDLRHYKNPKTWQVHQLVAMAFLNHKPNGYRLVVNHINFNKRDNNVYNLEIITQRQNTNRQHMSDYSKLLGVGINRSRNKFQSKIVINKKQIHLGYFNLDEEIKAGEYYKIALENINQYKGDSHVFREFIIMKFQESLINKRK